MLPVRCVLATAGHEEQLWWIYSRSRSFPYGLRLLNYMALISPCNSLESQAGCGREEQFVLLVVGLVYGQRCSSALRIAPEKEPAALPAPSLPMGPVALVPLLVLGKHGSVFKQDDAAFQGELPCRLPVRACQEPKYHSEMSEERKSCAVHVEN